MSMIDRIEKRNAAFEASVREKREKLQKENEALLKLPEFLHPYVGLTVWQDSCNEIWVHLKKEPERVTKKFDRSLASPAIFNLEEAVELSKQLELQEIYVYRVPQGWIEYGRPNKRDDVLPYFTTPAKHYFTQVDIHNEVELVCYTVVEGQRFRIVFELGKIGYLYRSSRYNEVNRTYKDTRAAKHEGADSIVFSAGSNEYPDKAVHFIYDIEAFIKSVAGK